MTRDFRTSWIVAGALFSVLTLVPLPPAVALGGRVPAISREGSPPGDRHGIPERGRTAAGKEYGASPGTGGVRGAQAREVTPDKLERWRAMPPEEKERIRERYRQWKQLSPRRRERILDYRRRWDKLPEEEKRFLRQRREIYRNAPPEEREAIRKFFRDWKRLPPDQRRALRRDMTEWKDLSGKERNERLMQWPFYRKFSPRERSAVDRFLFMHVPQGPKGGPPGSSRD